MSCKHAESPISVVSYLRTQRAGDRHFVDGKSGGRLEGFRELGLGMLKTRPRSRKIPFLRRQMGKNLVPEMIRRFQISNQQRSDRACTKCAVRSEFRSGRNCPRNSWQKRERSPREMVQAFRRRPRAWLQPVGQIVSLPVENQSVRRASCAMKLFEQAGKLKA